MRTSPAVRILAFLLLLTAPLSASIRLRIDEIGIKGWSGWYGHGMDPIRFTIENDGPAATLKLTIKTVNLGGSGVSSVYQERFLAPEGKSQAMRLLAVTPTQSVSVELSGDDGNVIANATSAGVTRSVIRGHLVVVYCRDPVAFENVRRSAVRSDDAGIRTRKERELDFVRVENLESQPWYYNSATAILLVEPLAATAEQKRSLEMYVRGGGQLVVSPATALSTGFSTEYFSEGNSVRMGLGTVYEVGSFEPSQLSSFSTNFLAGDSGGETVLQNVAWRMHFPKMRTMLLLTISYILMIGVLNFAILRRMGRLEWGWITVPAVALVFTFVVIAFGVTRGFTKVRVDQAETYYMDSHSATAYVYDGVRVTSPSRGDFTLQLAPGDYFAVNPNNMFGSVDKVHIGEEILEEHSDSMRRTWHFNAEGDRVGVELTMMRWSYEEWFGKRFEDLKGTVELSGKNVKNLTGIRFKKAIVVDHHMDKVFDLGAMEANATAELNSPQQLLPREFVIGTERVDESSLEMNIWKMASLTSMSKAFVGLAEVDEPGTESGPRVIESPSQQTRTRIFVVGLE